MKKDIVASEAPTSWMMVSDDEFTKRMFAAVNGMMLDVLGKPPVTAAFRQRFALGRRRASSTAAVR